MRPTFVNVGERTNAPSTERCLVDMAPRYRGEQDQGWGVDLL